MFYILHFYTLHYFYSSSMIDVLTMMLTFLPSLFRLGINCRNCCSLCNCILCFLSFYRSTRIFSLLIVVFLFFRSFIKLVLFLFVTFYASFSEMWTPLDKPWVIKDAVDLYAAIFWMENQISEDELFADLLTFSNAIFFFLLLHSTLRS